MNFEDMLWLYNTDRTRGISRINLDEAALLWRSVKLLQSRMMALGRRDKPTVLEIGTRLGGTTVLLLAAGCKVITVDLAPEIDLQVVDLLCVHEASGRLKSIVGDSKELDISKYLKSPDDEKLDIIFVDGDHTHDGCRGDVDQHWPYLRTGGLAIFHDAKPCTPGHSEGVARVVEELLTNKLVGFESKVVETVRSTIVLEKL